MPIPDVIKFVEDEALRFGGTSGSSYRLRNNAKHGASDQNKAYFALVQPEEEVGGAYHDFSLTFMPGGAGQKWLITLCVGTSGFKSDYELASIPGPRRLFRRLIDENGFCRTDFADIETKLPDTFATREDLAHLANTIGYYSPYFSVCQIVNDPESDDGKRLVSAFTAAYAKLRGWGTSKVKEKNISKALDFRGQTEVIDHQNAVEALLQERRYVVLQGAPGTGKTRIATWLAKKMNAHTFFTQFHAETSYSDFIFGIRPNVETEQLSYSNQRGVFADAVSFALENPAKKVLLIIDEINRANLSNVLGPTFYLFEHKRRQPDDDNGNTERDETDNFTINIAPGLSVKELPKNFYVVATMNTADRSLAVVDFALRRRFAWYTLKPEPVAADDFHLEEFNRFQEIFEWYAAATELPLQPGQGYFFANTEEEMENRLRFELLPLIQEYLNEGLLMNAREEFNAYFADRIKQQLFE